MCAEIQLSFGISTINYYHKPDGAGWDITRRKDKMKKLILMVAILMGLSTAANAQFFEFLQKAASTVSNVVNTTNDVVNTAKDWSNSSNSNSSNSYTSLGTCSAISFNSYGSARATIEIVKTSSGSTKVLRNGNLHNYYENPYYDEYCTDRSSKSYYKYYTDLGSRYYFNF